MILAHSIPCLHPQWAWAAGVGCSLPRTASLTVGSSVFIWQLTLTNMVRDLEPDPEDSEIIGKIPIDLNHVWIGLPVFRLDVDGRTLDSEEGPDSAGFNLHVTAHM